jgi:hypothetical protein
MTIRENIRRKNVWDQTNGMIMGVVERGKSMGSVRNILVLGDYRLEVGTHQGCLNYLNGMELGNNAKMTFFY